MDERESKPYSSVVSGSENGESRVGVSQRKSTEPVGHWAFLNEIEAPMWVDLTFEAKCSYQANDDEWFHTSHPFHQCSSRQLISSFSHSGEGGMNLDFGLQGPSSPKLLSSVLRSRGKNYRSGQCKERNCRITSKKRHPVNYLGSKSSRVNSGSHKEIKPKSKFGNRKASLVDRSGLTENSGSNHAKSVSSVRDSKTRSSSISTSRLNSGSDKEIKPKSKFGNPKASLVDRSDLTEVSGSNHSQSVSSVTDSKASSSSISTSWVNSGSHKEIKPKSKFGNPTASLVDRSSLTENSGSNRSKSVSSFGDSKTSSTSITIKECESKERITITSESSEQEQKKFLEMSSQNLGGTSGLLSTLKIALRKSCVTRQASRVMIVGGRKSDGTKSSLRKSSVGSSWNVGNDVKDATIQETQNKDKTPDSRNVMRMSRAVEEKVKVLNGLKGSSAQVQNMNSKSIWGSKTMTSKSSNQETQKSKVHYPTLHEKGMVVHGVNKQGTMTAATKVKDKVVISRHNKLTSDGKENAICRMSWNTKSRTIGKASEGMSEIQKAKKQNVPPNTHEKRLIGPKEKISGRRGGENVTQKVYLR